MENPLRATEELLILTKTYPSPSTRHRETTCVAALTRQGEMRRVFPVPFRFLSGEFQFQKWEWIRALMLRPNNDNRPESRKIDVDTIERLGEKLNTKQSWTERRTWLEPHWVENFAALEARREESKQTLGILRPSRLLGLDITPVKETEWTEAEKIKLSQEGLFDDHEYSRLLLRKLPFDFHYRYECSTPDGVEANRHKITDWEVGALYWNCVRSHGPRWQEPFRHRLEEEFAAKDLMLLMGTIHRFPGQWLIVGLFYPPKPSPQLSLGLR